MDLAKLATWHPPAPHVHICVQCVHLPSRILCKCCCASAAQVLVAGKSSGDACASTVQVQDMQALCMLLYSSGEVAGKSPCTHWPINTCKLNGWDTLHSGVYHSVYCKKQKNIGVAIQYPGTETEATERDFGNSM
jgi:hypothetical protein